MGYPVKCGWISWKKDKGRDRFIVKNERLSEEYVMTGQEVGFIERMDGRTDPIPLLECFFGMDEEQARYCVKLLEGRKIIRERTVAEAGSKIGICSLDCERFRLPGKILLWMGGVCLVPVLWLGLHDMNREILAGIFSGADISAMQMWAGTILGLCVGMLLHGLFRTAARTVTSRRAPAVLAGIMGNLIAMSLGFFACRTVAGYPVLFYLSGLANLECALFGITFIKISFAQYMVPVMVLLNLCMLIFL